MHLGRSGGAWLLCSLLHPTTEHLNRLGAILVYICSGGETMADWWQITQGGSKVKHQCQSTIVGGAWVCVMSHWEWLDLRKGKWFKEIKNTGWIFIIIGWLFTHTANTQSFWSQQNHTFLLGDVGQTKTTCSKIGWKYQTCLISSDCVDLESEATKSKSVTIIHHMIFYEIGQLISADWLWL